MWVGVGVVISGLCVFVVASVRAFIVFRVEDPVLFVISAPFPLLHFAFCDLVHAASTLFGRFRIG